jgi:hypothetical protein
MRVRNAPEHELIERVLGKLKQDYGLNIIHECDHKRTDEAGRIRIIDAKVTIDIQGRLYVYAAEAKRTFTKATIALAMQQLKAGGQTALLIAEYINPQQAEDLQRQQIAFVDAAGNAYLKAGPVYIYVRGNRPEQMPRRAAGQATRAFQATGLRVLFGFLRTPELVNATYRDIARVTGVARGTVGGVVNDLREAGYLLEVRKEWRLIGRRQILDRWIEAYHERLKPKLWLGRYEAPTHDWWQTVDLQPWAAVWGGEVAAAKLTNGFLKPQITTIYAPQLPVELLLRQRLLKNPDGDVHIFQTFWLEEDDQINPVAAPETTDPLLVYADLIGTGDDRNRETAQLIFDRRLCERFPGD